MRSRGACGSALTPSNLDRVDFATGGIDRAQARRLVGTPARPAPRRRGLRMSRAGDAGKQSSSAAGLRPGRVPTKSPARRSPVPCPGVRQHERSWIDAPSRQTVHWKSSTPRHQLSTLLAVIVAAPRSAHALHRLPAPFKWRLNTRNRGTDGSLLASSLRTCNGRRALWALARFRSVSVWVRCRGSAVPRQLDAHESRAHARTILSLRHVATHAIGATLDTARG
jgi:hypothetical protein